MQFIPRLSSTSINNKHLHETRASLRGRRRHRPARSTSDETLCLLGPHWAPHLLSTGLVLSSWDPQAPSLLMPSRTYQSCCFINSDRDPSVLTVAAESTCGSWQETDALYQDSSASLMMRPLSFHQLALSSCDWRLVQHSWHGLALGWGIKGAWKGGCLLTHRYCVWCNTFCLSHSHKATVTG